MSGRRRKEKLGIALAGGGPLGGIYENHLRGRVSLPSNALLASAAVGFSEQRAWTASNGVARSPLKRGQKSDMAPPRHL